MVAAPAPPVVHDSAVAVLSERALNRATLARQHLLAHQDRSRFLDADLRGFHTFTGTVLVDGGLRALWRLAGGTCLVEHAPLSRRQVGEVEEEVGAAMAFLHEGRHVDVRLSPL